MGGNLSFLLGIETHSTGIVAAASLCNINQLLQVVGLHFRSYRVELQSSAVYPQILDASLKVAPKRRRTSGVRQPSNKNLISRVSVDFSDDHRALGLC